MNLYRRLPGGGYTAIPPAQSGINLNEFYADNLSPGDWNDDGKLDLAGSGNPCTGSDGGFGLWTSNLATTNGWILRADHDRPLITDRSWLRNRGGHAEEHARERDLARR